MDRTERQSARTHRLAVSIRHPRDSCETRINSAINAEHFTWFFLPWHRMYLEWFERIIRSAIAGLADIDDETKRTWALPYWNYSSDDAARNIYRRRFWT